jgi:two-component system phosphate regulon response regulator PhoB
MSARILIVEDEEPLTMLLRYNLEAEGYEVETAARGDDADTRLKESPPDLVVLDWMLPGLSGIELCRRLRARPETRQLPIIHGRGKYPRPPELDATQEPRLTWVARPFCSS